MDFVILVFGLGIVRVDLAAKNANWELGGKPVESLQRDLPNEAIEMKKRESKIHGATNRPKHQPRRMSV